MRPLDTFDLVLIGLLLILTLYYWFDRWLHRRQKRKGRPYTWPITIRVSHSFTIKGIIMQVTIHPGNEVPITLGKPIHKDQSEAEIQDGTLEKSVADENVATFDRDDKAINPDDPYVGKFVWRGAGNTKFKMKGDADLGDGVETIEYDIDILCLPEAAVGFAGPSVGAERPHVEESAAPGE